VLGSWGRQRDSDGLGHRVGGVRLGSGKKEKGDDGMETKGEGEWCVGGSA